MFKKAVFIGLGVALLVSPFALSAQSLTREQLIAQLQAQLDALLAQVGVLQQQLLNHPTPVDGQCVNLSYNMGADDTDANTNGEVTKLQRFLVSTGDLSMPWGASYGYFGPATERAVQSWQSRNGIVSGGTPDTTGYGYVGPKTRAAMAAGCTGGNGRLSASPTSGKAPLSVTFTASVNGNRIDFGDGTSAMMPPIPPCFYCPTPSTWTQMHTYASPGTYVAKLVRSNGWWDTSTDPSCIGVCADILDYGNNAYQEIVGTATITVTDGSGQTATLIASPSSGPAPLTSTLTVTASAGTYALNFGEGNTVRVDIPQIVCITTPCNPAPQTFSHTYATAGTYTARLSLYIECLHGNAQFQCKMAEPPPLATVTITVTGSSGSFTATPSSGKAPLNVSFGGPVSSGGFTIDFGDGKSFSSGCAHGSCPIDSTSYVDVVHAYSAAGTYVAKLKRHYKVNEGMCQGTDCNVVGTVTVTVTSDGSSAAPVVTGIEGPASLNIGQQGTWKVNANVPNNSGASIAYSVVWGDEAGGAQAVVPPTQSVQTSATFTHSYQNAGAYQPKFTVSNSSGSNSASLSVNVGGQVTGATTLSVSPNSGNAPLTVTATITAPPQSGVEICGPIMVGDLSWGDGSAVEKPTRLGCSSQRTVTATHTYSATGTYAVKLTPPNESDKTATVVVTSAQTDAPTGSITFGASQVPYGSTVQVSWTSANTKQCVVRDSGNNVYGGKSGSIISQPLYIATTFTLQCSVTSEEFIGTTVKDPITLDAKTVTLSGSSANAQLSSLASALAAAEQALNWMLGR